VDQQSRGDFHVALMSYRARKNPSYDPSAFHSQQCAEKYLKARLEEGGIAFVRTNDLLVLHQSALRLEPAWVVLQPFLIFLNPFAVAYRYPGISATRVDAQDALRNCREARRIARTSFGLGV